MFFSGKKYHLYFLGFLAFISIYLFVLSLSVGDNKLKVSFLDIGQGDSILIQAPNGNQMLVDGGPPTGALERRLGEELPFWDRFIDVVLMTHPDQDHIGGFVNLLKNYQAGVFVEPGVGSDNGVYQTLENEVEEKGIHKILARRGMRINLGSGVVFDILFPDRDTTGWETNRASIVGRLSYGNNSFLLTGDSPTEIEHYLIGLDKKLATSTLQSDVLKAGHHGSHTSSSEEYVRRVSPQYAIISAGKNNKYGHPHKEVVDLLNSLNIPILSTINMGTITFESDGINLVYK